MRQGSTKPTRRLPDCPKRVDIGHLDVQNDWQFCNRHKGSNLSGIDPKTDLLTRLFHPRRHAWSYHFRWDGAKLRGRTAIGRTTIRVLKINALLRVILREELIAAGVVNQIGK
jgi:hypothetical protein